MAISPRGDPMTSTEIFYEILNSPLPEEGFLAFNSTGVAREAQVMAYLYALFNLKPTFTL